MLQKLHTYLWPALFAWRKLPLLTLLETAVSLLSVAFPALNILAIANLGNAIATKQDLLVPLSLVVALFASRTLVSQLETLAARVLSTKLLLCVGNAYYEKTKTIPAYLYQDVTFHDNLRQINGAVEGGYVKEQFMAMQALFLGLAAGLSLCYALWDYSWLAALLAAFLPVPLMANNLSYGKAFQKHYGNLQNEAKRRNYLFDQLDKDRTGLDLAVIQGRNDIAQLGTTQRQKVYDIMRRLAHTALTYCSLSTAIAVAIYTSCLYLLAQDSTVTFVAGFMGLTTAVATLSYMGYYLGVLGRTVIPNQKLYSYLHSNTSPCVTKHPVDASQELTLSNVTVNYGTKLAVNNVSLTLKPGCLTALVGANGSGKTSLIKALMGVQTSATGRLTNGTTKLDLSQHDQAVSFATVNQEFQKYDITVREFLTLGMNQQPSDEQLWQALEQVAMHEQVKALPQGLDSATGVQWNGVDLSGGQWQRLCIARSLLSPQGLLILDEPTSAIDAPTEEKIFAHLAQVSKQRHVLLTTHRVSTLQEAQVIYVMEQGQVVETGSFAELNHAGTKFRELFESQFVGQEDSNGNDASSPGATTLATSTPATQQQA